MTDDQEVEPGSEAMPEDIDDGGSSLQKLVRLMQAENIAAEIDEDDIQGIACRS